MSFLSTETIHIIISGESLAGLGRGDAEFVGKSYVKINKIKLSENWP